MRHEHTDLYKKYRYSSNLVHLHGAGRLPESRTSLYLKACAALNWRLEANLLTGAEVFAICELQNYKNDDKYTGRYFRLLRNYD